MSTVPLTFDDLDRVLDPDEIWSQCIFFGSEIVGIRHEPCWGTSVLQWMLDEVSGKEIQLLGPNSQALSRDELAKIRNTLTGAALCLLPAEMFARPSPNEVIEHRTQLLVEQRAWPDVASNGCAFVLCADHLVSARPRLSKADSNKRYLLPHRLYPDPQTSLPTDWAGFNKLLIDLVQAVCARPMQPTWTDPALETAIPTILHELFKNTHDHARTWWDGTQPKHSLRGIVCNYYELCDLDYIAKHSRSKVLDPASSYIRELLDIAKEGRTTQSLQSATIKGFIELSVFDSGPGFVGCSTKNDPTSLSAQRQLEIVRQCLRKGYSSTDNETRGFGLSKVLSRLRRAKGFIRIRTNAVSGYRSFARFNELETIKSLDTEATYDRLLDWRNLYSPRQTIYRSLRGAIVTVLIPMSDIDG